MSVSKFDIHDVKFVDIINRDRDLERAKVGIVGIPHDRSTRGRPGARFAPQKIRERLYKYSTYCIDYSVDISELTVKDFGDINVHLESLKLIKGSIENSLSDILGKADVWVILGGDHSITEPSLRAISKKVKGKVGLVIIDAHHDLRELPEGHISSGTVIGDIIRTMKNKVEPRHIAQIGIRGFVNSRYYVEKARELGLMIYTVRDVRKLGISRIMEEILNNLEGVDGIYFSFDVDGADIVYAPGVNAPSIGGLTPIEIFDIAFCLGKNEKVLAMDVTEHAPAYDVAGVTTDLAASAILYFLAGVAKR